MFQKKNPRQKLYLPPSEKNNPYWNNFICTRVDGNIDIFSAAHQAHYMHAWNTHQAQHIQNFVGKWSMANTCAVSFQRCFFYRNRKWLWIFLSHAHWVHCAHCFCYNHRMFLLCHGLFLHYFWLRRLSQSSIAETCQFGN